MEIIFDEIEISEIKEEHCDAIPSDVFYELVKYYRDLHGDNIFVVELDTFLEMANTDKIRYVLRSTILAGNIVGKVKWDNKQSYYIVLLDGNTAI